METKGSRSGAGTPGEGTNPQQNAPRDRQVAGASSNVVPKESVVRAAMSIAAAGSLTAEDSKSAQQGQWVTASFDDVPDR